jgi:hypothetical protein
MLYGVAEAAAQGAPLKADFRRGFEYSDCWVEDSRLVVLNARDAAERGAAVWTRTTAAAARRVDGLWEVQLHRDGRSTAMRARALVALLAAATLLTGCRIDVATDVGFDRSGAGEVAVTVRIDGATLRQLDAAGVDPELDVALGLGPDPAWRVERSVDADGGLVLTYRQAFSDGVGATALLRELSEDVAPQDPALRLDVTVITTRSGAVRLGGTGAVSPPATLGVSFDDVAVGPSGEELAALVAEAVRAQLVVRVPGRVVQHDADVLDGRTLRWTLPVGEPRTIVLVADGLPSWRRIPTWMLASVTLLMLSGGALMSRSRRGARAGEMDGGPEVSRRA